MVTSDLLVKLRTIGRVAFRIAVWLLVALNIAVLAPGVYFGIRLGHYTPIVVGILLSLLFWTAGWVVVRLVGGKLNNEPDTEAADR